MPLALNYSGVRGNDFSTATTTRDAVGVKLTLWRIVYLLNALKFSSYTKQKNLKFYFKKKEKKNMKFLIQKNRRQLRQVKKNYKKKIVVYIYRRISQYKNLSLLGALIINFSVSFSLFFYTHRACGDSLSPVSRIHVVAPITVIIDRLQSSDLYLNTHSTTTNRIREIHKKTYSTTILF